MDASLKKMTAPLSRDGFFEVWFNNSHLAVAILDRNFDFVCVNKA